MQNTNSSPVAVPLALGRQANLDGIRAIAVLAVLAFHINPGWLPGGFLGVDVFFTLSGFLITTLLLEEQFAAGSIALRAFFTRRVKRLYPALVAMVLVSTAFTLYFHREIGAARTGFVALSVLGYAANWVNILDPNGWFGGMFHAWSLAIEVHFYVIWALLVTLLAQRFGGASDRNRLLRILAIIATVFVLGSVVWRAFLWQHSASWGRVYLGTDTHVDGVFIGCLIALYRLHLLSTPGKKSFLPTAAGGIFAIEVAAVVGLSVLLLAAQFGAPSPWALGFTGAGLATGVLILTTTLTPVTILSTALRVPAFSYLGRISYSLYLWQVPVIKLLGTDRLIAAGFRPIVADGIRLGVSVVIGMISYHLIERAFVRPKSEQVSPPDEGSSSEIEGDEVSTLV